MISGHANLSAIGARAQASEDEAVVPAAGMFPRFTTGGTRGAFGSEKGSGCVAKTGGKVIQETSDAGGWRSHGP